MKSSFLQLLLVVCSIAASQQRSPAQSRLECPSECTCYVAPLHDAPFVHDWLRRRPVRKHPDLHENDVLDESAVAADHASDVDVDMDSVGVHTTCALYPGTNVTTLMNSLSRDTMVLTLLQAVGCNYTVIEAGQLNALTELRALHIQGFAYRKRHHISGLAQSALPNALPLTSDNRHNSTKRYWKKLNMAVTDDALKSLINLEILDLQYVRLIAKDYARRPRRNTWGPISTTNLIDSPLSDIFSSLNINPSRAIFDNDSSTIPESEPIDDPDKEDEREALVDQYYESVMRMVADTVSFNESKIIQSSQHVESILSSMNSDPIEEVFAPFSSQVNLKYLRIAHAQLDKLGQELLAGLINVQTLILEFNQIHVLPADVFSPAQKIEHLSLAHNSLLNLESQSLRGLDELVSLDITNNKVTIIGPESLPHLPKLKSLFLKGNPIKHVLPESFHDVTSLNTLEIGSLEVSSRIHGHALRNLKNLKLLHLSNLSYNSFDSKLFMYTPNLEDLTIHGSLPKLSFDAFTSVPSLKRLDLSECGIHKISVDAFYSLTQLKYLDLNTNNLTALSPGIFDTLSSLTELYLQDNQITELPLGLFASISLKVLRVNNNPWICSCYLAQLDPSITNTVSQRNYQMCTHDGKSTIECNSMRATYVYDDRVAPKCSYPEKYKGKDVYSVVSTFFKCSKHHWNPKIYLPRAESERFVPTESSQGTKNLQPIENDETEYGHKLSWRPLRDFTPRPVKIPDLLSIAEGDMLEEAATVAPIPVPAPSTVVLAEGLSKAEQKRIMAESARKYQESKRKIKERLHNQRVQLIEEMIKSMHRQ